MALQSSGAISLANIQTEFGGSNPISLSEYYAGGSYVPSGTSGTNGAVPTSGTITFNQFYGTSAIPRGQVEYTTPGTYYFIVPAGVTSVCGVAVGGGSGGPSGSRYGAGSGGGLAYKNNISVTPGARLRVVVGAGGAGGAATSYPYGNPGTAGGPSYLFWNEGPPGAWSNAISAFAGQASYAYGDTPAGLGVGGDDGVKYGGAGRWAPTFGFEYIRWGGGGGAAGYSDNGGAGGPTSIYDLGGESGRGGGGGGGMFAIGNDEGQNPYTSVWGKGASTGGGGVGIYGQGSNGGGGQWAGQIVTGGGGGSGGQTAPSRTRNDGYDSGEDGGPGGAYGGGGASGSAWVGYPGSPIWRKGGDGGGGAVRIIWGPGRSFPSINTGNV